MIDALCHVLGNTCRIARIAISYQWNARGPGSFQAETEFREQAGELHEALDHIAEHIRSLGGVAILDYTDSSLTANAPTPLDLPALPEMIQIMISAHGEACISIEAAIDIAEEAAERPSVQLLTDRIAAHRRHGWRTRMMDEGRSEVVLPQGSQQTLHFGRP
ncbi:MAG: ferritin-like domain-containing protein [Pseudomonadota bacterium]